MRHWLVRYDGFRRVSVGVENATDFQVGCGAGVGDKADDGRMRQQGLSARPSLTRTWDPRGQMPQRAFNFNWGKLAVIAGITWCASASDSIAERSGPRRSSTAAAAFRPPAGDLGRPSRPESSLRRRHRRAVGAGALTGLGARTQPHGIQMGASEATRLGPLLSQRLAPPGRRGAEETAPFPAARFPRPRLLETGRDFWVTKCHPFMQDSIK